MFVVVPRFRLGGVNISGSGSPDGEGRALRRRYIPLGTYMQYDRQTDSPVPHHRRA